MFLDGTLFLGLAQKGNPIRQDFTSSSSSAVIHRLSRAVAVHLQGDHDKGLGSS